MLRRPFQNLGVVLSRKPGVLNADYIQSGIASQQPAEDVVVEILVETEADHRVEAERSGASGQQPGAQALRIEASFILPACGGAIRRPLRKVSGHFGLMPENVTQHGVHIRQPEAGVLLDNLLRRRASLKGVGDRFQRDPRAGHADDAIGVRGQWHGLRLFDDQAHALNANCSA